MRNFLATALISATLAFGGCTPSNQTGWTNAVNTADTVVNSLALEVPLIQAAFPAVLSPDVAAQVNNALNLAKADIATLRADIAAGTADAKGTPTIEELEGYINQAIAAAAPIMTAVCTPAIPRCAEVQAVYQDIVLAAPLIELFINNVHPTSQVAKAHIASTRASAVPSHGRPVMSATAALADLKQRTGR